MAGRNFVASAAVRIFVSATAAESLWYRLITGDAARQDAIVMANNKMEHGDLRSMCGILSVVPDFVAREWQHVDW